MNLQQYHRQRAERREREAQFRSLCQRCLQPDFGCYCAHVQSFDPQIQFVILIHPIEVRRRIATGRMSHLCLKNSQLISGQDYSYHPLVNDLIEDPLNQTMILYPGRDSINLSSLEQKQRQDLFQPHKKLVLFVIDGTWATAKKMMRESLNLKALPKICFTPEKPSTFRVRKQPDIGCYSTIEAIHQVIELIGDHQGFPTQQRGHDHLLKVFDRMVERQLDFIQKSRDNPELSHYRPFRKRSLA